MIRALNAESFDFNLCSGMKIKITVDSGGYLKPCLPFGKHTAGSIFDSRPIPEILGGSSLYHNLRRHSKKDLECRNCRFINYCVPCYGGILSEHGSFIKPGRSTCNMAKALHDILIERGQIESGTTKCNKIASV
jgi:radical SAM protein with 4Fe4S-binding SPASM domain